MPVLMMRGLLGVDLAPAAVSARASTSTGRGAAAIAGT